MPKNSANQIPTKLRLLVCDWLMDDTEYDEIRQRLIDRGLDQDALPSDFCLRKYKDGPEYQEQYQARLIAHRLEHWDIADLDPSRDWQKLLADHNAARMLMVLNVTPNIDLDTLIRLSRSQTQQQSLAFRKMCWEADHASQKKPAASPAPLLVAQARRHAEPGPAPVQRDLPPGMPVLDVAFALEDLQDLVEQRPDLATDLGVAPEDVAHMRQVYRISSTEDVTAEWRALAKAGDRPIADIDQLYRPTGSDRAHVLSCMDQLLLHYAETHAPLSSPGTKSGAPAQNRTESDKNVRTATDRQADGQKGTESDSPAQILTDADSRPAPPAAAPPARKPDFANSPSSATRAKARRKRKKAKR